MPTIRFQAVFAPLFALAVAAIGCSDDSAAGDAGVANITPPAECAINTPPAGWSYPAGPYGGDVDDTFADFTVKDCDGNEFRFGDVLAQAELVLLNIGAGWCEPCVAETMTLDREVFREFCPRGLRVVQVLFEDEDSEIPTSLFCKQWRDSFSLSFPVLVDQLFVTETYFTSVLSQTPINFLIDPSGKIVFKSTGEPPADLGQRIDQLLPR